MIDLSKARLHTPECLDYARQTRRAFCIVQCRDERRRREQDELEAAVRGDLPASASAEKVPRRCTPEDDYRTHDPADGPVLVTIHYFKPGSGKHYTEDEDVLWFPDASHYNKWQPFSSLVRLRDMFAVCMATPLGFPVGCPPSVTT